MIQTCQPYGCELVMVFGFFVGTGALIVSLVLTFYAGKLTAWLHRRRVDGLQAKVDAKYPTWRNTVNTARFHDWLLDQSEEVRALAASWKPEDAIEILRRYEQHR